MQDASTKFEIVAREERAQGQEKLFHRIAVEVVPSIWKATQGEVKKISEEYIKASSLGAFDSNAARPTGN